MPHAYFDGPPIETYARCFKCTACRGYFKAFPESHAHSLCIVLLSILRRLAADADRKVMLLAKAGIRLQAAADAAPRHRRREMTAAPQARGHEQQRA